MLKLHENHLLRQMSRRGFLNFSAMVVAMSTKQKYHFVDYLCQQKPCRRQPYFLWLLKSLTEMKHIFQEEIGSVLIHLKSILSV